MKLSVLYICDEYPDQVGYGGGGIGTSYRNVAEGIVREGGHVYVVGLYKILNDRRECINGVHVHRIAARWGRYGCGLLNRRRLSRCIEDLIGSQGIRIVEAPDYGGAFWLLRRWRVKHVVRICGSTTYFRRLLGERNRLKTYLAERATLRKADHIITKSHYSWGETKRLFRLPPDLRAEYVPNPIDVDVFSPGDRSAVIPGRLLYTGKMIRKKGVLDLFRALPQILAAVPHSHLVCIGGDAPDMRTGSRSTLALALQELPTEYHSRVEFHGRQSRRAVLDQLHAAEICVLPSHLEVFPNTWLEAMACAKPIVASNTGSGPEIIEHNESGLLCNPYQAKDIAASVLRLLRDPVKAQRLANAARRRVESRYATATVIAQNMDCYSRFLTTG